RIEEGQRQIVSAVARSGFIVESFIETFDTVADEEFSTRLGDLVQGFTDYSDVDADDADDTVEVDAPVDDSDDEEEEVKTLDYNEVKEKVDLLKKALKSAMAAVK